MTDHNDVTNPAHYDLFPGQQAIDVIQAALTPEEYAGYLKGNALKYRLRAGEKGDPAQCLAKANWYRDRLRGEPQVTHEVRVKVTEGVDLVFPNGKITDMPSVIPCSEPNCRNPVVLGSRQCVVHLKL